MTAAKLNGDLKALQERVTELERQLLALKQTLNSGRTQPRRPWTEEDAQAYHEASQRVQKIIETNREADRRRAAAEYDRLHGRPKKGPARQKSSRQAARRAG